MISPHCQVSIAYSGLLHSHTETEREGGWKREREEDAKRGEEMAPR